MNADTSFQTERGFSSWGRIVREPHQVARPQFRDALPGLVQDVATSGPGLAVGMKRSYGDSVLNPEGRVIDMTALDRFIAFDRTTGLVRAEAGVTLSQLLQVLVPAGFFLPTTPGTRFATLGGAVANDVHGKNHHAAGTFGHSVTRIGLLRSDTGATELTPQDRLFAATVGGLGLTGVISWVEFQAVRIGSAMLAGEDVVFRNVGEYFELSAERKSRFEHTMAWIDCLSGGSRLGRGILSCANWAASGPLTPHVEAPRKKMPIEAPGFALNTLSVKAFNTLYNGVKTMNAGRYTTHYEPFLYPLDAIADWNRLYGARGFWQYQCAVPPANAREAVTAMLKRIAKSGQGSFLAVLKDFGERPSCGLLSFPMPGSTLALDFPNKGPRTVRLMADLDAIVREAGGRLYPAKDGRIPPDMFRASYPAWEELAALADPALSSRFWRRVTQ